MFSRDQRTRMEDVGDSMISSPNRCVGLTLRSGALKLCMAES